MTRIIIIFVQFLNPAGKEVKLTFINEFVELLKRKRRAKDDNDFNQLAIACHNLGEYYNDHTDYENALKNFQEAAAAHKSSGSSDIIELGRSHRMIGEMYMLLGDFEKSLKHEQIYLGNVTPPMLIYGLHGLVLVNRLLSFQIVRSRHITQLKNNEHTLQSVECIYYMGKV